MKKTRIILTVIAVVCFAIALSYPVLYTLQRHSNESDMEELSALRREGMAAEQPDTAKPHTYEPYAAPAGTAVAGTAQAGVQVTTAIQTTAPVAVMATSSVTVPEYEPALAQSAEALPTAFEKKDEGGGDATVATSHSPATIMTASVSEQPATDSPEAAVFTPAPTPTPTPAPTLNRRGRTGALPYPEKEKLEFDPARLLKRYAAVYKLNEDLIGWLSIPDTQMDYPVVQSDNNDFYLDHDFFGEENKNGQIVLDARCDPYTPSYNLVISGHNMRSGSMFGALDSYEDERFWEAHKQVQFDTLMDERRYVVFAAFYSADYDVDESGFRYNADIQYRLEAEQWLADIEKNRLYDTGIDVEFGDEFLTLTTCNRERRSDGRFVVVCRRLREGEVIQ